MRALPVFAVLLLCGCQSGVTLDTSGSLQFPCVEASTTEKIAGGCPGDLFCGSDKTCHARDAGGTYGCKEDVHCVAPFRCGPQKSCLDPSADALRADAPDVVLTKVDEVKPVTPWDAGITALGIGRTAQMGFGGPLKDFSPVAVAAGRYVYVLASSQQGFAASQQFYVGVADLGFRVTEVAAVRNQVLALAGGNLFHFDWTPSFDGGIATLAPGTPEATTSTRLRVGNSGFPMVYEFAPDAGNYRVIDTAPATRGVQFAGNLGGRINDMAHTDGTYSYAVVDGRVQILNHRFALQFNAWNNWGTFAINSPGRDVQLTNCGGSNGSVERYTVRGLHVGDNPNLAFVERPLVALSLDVERQPDGGTAPYWMRIDLDFGECGTNRPRHIARGFCPACGPEELLVDLQWGTDAEGEPMLRSECREGPRTKFYDLQTDSTGFACYQTPRQNVGYQGPLHHRSGTSAFQNAVAAGEAIQTRRNGFDEYVPVTLDRAPVIAHSYGDAGVVALGARTLYRQTRQLGLALHDQGDRQSAFPAWITGKYLIYDDGRVGPITNLDDGPQGAKYLGIPTRRDLSGPVFGTVAKTADNRTFMVMVANDALLGADLTNAGMPPAPIEVKLVPEPQVQIRSIAVLDATASDGGSLFEGYVLTDNRLFTLEAATDDVWTLAQVTLTREDPREVWADRERGRLGYEDGVVYSLPSVVPISGGVPGGKVRDFQHHCGRSYALTETGLYRLESTAAALGEWKQESVLPAGPKWQRLYGAATGDLWVFASDGRGVLLKGAPCTP